MLTKEEMEAAEEEGDDESQTSATTKKTFSRSSATQRLDIKERLGETNKETNMAMNLNLNKKKEKFPKMLGKCVNGAIESKTCSCKCKPDWGGIRCEV